MLEILDTQGIAAEDLEAVIRSVAAIGLSPIVRRVGRDGNRLMNLPDGGLAGLSGLGRL